MQFYRIHGTIHIGQYNHNFSYITIQHAIYTTWTDEKQYATLF